MPKLHIVITDVAFPDTQVEESLLSSLDATVTVGQCRSEDDVLAIARDADALMVQWAPITRRVMEQLTRCRIISRYGVGVDMIDLQAARDLGIHVVNVPDYCMEEVASQTLCFLLTLGRQIFRVDRLMRQGLWNLVDAVRPIIRFSSQTLGVVGVGRIGKRVAQLAAPLGIRILGYDIQPPKEPGPVQLVDFETLVRESDYLSLHCPLTEATRHLINPQVLRKMKPGAFLINMSRGGLVDTAALVEALSRGQIAGAALDVFEQEPLPAEHPLRRLDNVILTPHMASWSLDAAAQLRRDTARYVVEFFQGKAIPPSLLP
jgi:D-3-phosphoglycerate dehydrogenase